MTGMFISETGIFLKPLFRIGKHLWKSLTLWLRLLNSFGDLEQKFYFFSARVFRRAIVMPNLKPPVTTTASALAYRESIMKALPADCDFNPLMTLYLTDNTTPDEIKLASQNKKQSLSQINVFYVNLKSIIFNRKKRCDLCCEIISFGSDNKFARWCDRHIWKVSSCS